MTNEQLYGQASFTQLKKNNKSDIYTLAAYVYTGEHQKARWMAEHLRPHLNARDIVFVNFHLGISFTRTSHYKKAASYFKENLRFAQKHEQDYEIQFLSWQGLGFFYYFFSHHKKSLQAAYKAHKSLMKFNNKSLSPFYLILSLDLQGHNLIQRARIHQGIDTLQQAYDTALANKVMPFVNSVQFSLLLYKSRFIDSTNISIENLKKAFTEIDSHDDYSRSELVCEISNRLMLNGRFNDAKSFLTDNYKVIYESDNKRQMGQLNFRMTYSMFRQGSFEQALYLAKTARANLNSIIDRGLISQILGLEIKILSAMGESTINALNELKTIHDKTDNLLIKRINRRIFKENSASNKGEDPLGDIVDQLAFAKSDELFNELVKNEMFGLLGDFFEITSGKEFIVVNAPNAQTVVVNQGKIEVAKPLGNILIQLIKFLGEQTCTKEQIIQQVWSYKEYDPLRHDSLIYSSITRLRNLLNLTEHQLFFDGEGYRLNMSVLDYHQLHSQNVKEITKNPALVSKHFVQNQELMQFTEELNFRQFRILQNMDVQNLSVKSYSSLFKVTTMTALRDLRKLCEYGYLKKIGRGRATTYLKTLKPADKIEAL